MNFKKYFSVPGHQTPADLALLLIAIGPGRFSLDRLIFGSRR